MSDLFEGDFEGRCTKIEFGADGKGRPSVRGVMTIEVGDRKGQSAPYEGKLDERSIKFTKRDLMSLGWAGKTSATIVDDITKANKLVPFRVEIATWNKDDGSVKRWTSVRSIGFSAKPLEKLDNSKLADVDSWFAQAGGDNSDIPF